MEFRKRSKSNPLDETDLSQYDEIFNDIPITNSNNPKQVTVSKIDSFIHMIKWLYKKLTCQKSYTHLNI